MHAVHGKPSMQSPPKTRVYLPATMAEGDVSGAGFAETVDLASLVDLGIQDANGNEVAFGSLFAERSTNTIIGKTLPFPTSLYSWLVRPPAVFVRHFL